MGDAKWRVSKKYKRERRIQVSVRLSLLSELVFQRRQLYL